MENKKITILVLDDKLRFTRWLEFGKFTACVSEHRINPELIFEEELVPNLGPPQAFPSKDYPLYVAEKAQEADIVIVGNNLLAGAEKLMLLGEGIEHKTIVVWNSFVPALEKLKYKKMGYYRFGIREETVQEILKLVS